VAAKKKCNVGVPAEDPAGLPVIGQGPLAGVRKSKRGPWRAAVLITVHAVVALHVTHFLLSGRTLSPVEPSESMYTLELGYVNCGFVFFGIALLATLLFGRFFCGWGCHIVALQDFCAWLMRRVGVRPKPFRSRLLAYAPIVVALYMFVWPTFLRLATGGEFPGLTRHFTTTDLWATFPGPVFATLTFAVCGFAAVYTLGAKGFCTYGCPYGGLFGMLDYASPGRIVVSDACEQCGHCTATCTSNVRVHEEVRLYGMVVDPGCMKCMDCVSVCPKGALSFSLAKPALLKGVAPKKRTKTYDLSWPEEFFAAVVGAVATLAFRGLYDGPPLLMAVGLGGITSFLAVKLLHLSRRRDVRIQNLELKSGGALRRSGWLFAVVAAGWALFTGHSALAQWDRAWGRYELDRTEVSREEGLSGAFRARPLSDTHVHAADEAYRHFSRADRIGLAPVVEVKLGLAWCHVLRGDLEAAARYAREAAAISPGNAELGKNETDIETALHFERAGALVGSGDLEGAAREYEALVGLMPDAPAVRFNYGGVLRRLGRSDAAIEQLTTARDLVPQDPDVWVELGLSYAAAGRRSEAIDALRRAIALNPETPEARLHLPGLIEELREKGTVP